MTKVAILGGGSFGSALAISLAEQSEVVIWEINEDRVKEMHELRVCPLLPKLKIPHSIKVSNSMDIISDADVVLIVVPSNFVAATYEKAMTINPSAIYVNCSKGFCNGQIFSKTIDNSRLATFSGPTLAAEMAETTSIAVIASKSPEVGKELAELFSSSRLIIENSDDLVGVQVCAALKNVYAIWMGLLDGLGEGDNAKALFATYALREMKRVVSFLGGELATVESPAGIGDFLVTTGSQKSRNRTFGFRLGSGESKDEILDSMKMVVEGLKVLDTIKPMLEIEAPFITGLEKIILGSDPRTVFKKSVENSRIVFEAN